MLALEGIRVLDLSRQLPGPYCSMLLADLGADVLRIDDPGFGMGDRPRVAAAEKPDPGFAQLSRNKRSLGLNLKPEAGKQIFYQLAREADVILEGFRPGVTTRLKIDYETLRALNPRIIYCSLSGYGQDGPYSSHVGHDINYMGIAGALGIGGDDPDRPPQIPGTQVADIGGGGQMAAIGILAAIVARARTGRGQHIDIAMMDGVVSWLGMHLGMWWGSGSEKSPRRGEMLLNGAYPFYTTYQCADGKYVSIGAIEPWFWATLCRHLGHEEFIAQQYASGEQRQHIFKTLRAIFQTKPRDQWVAELQHQDICAGPVNDFAETTRDPQVLAREMIVDWTDEQGTAHKLVGIPVKLSETPGSIRTYAPSLGQHTAETLSALGYSDDDIERLRRDEVVR